MAATGCEGSCWQAFKPGTLLSLAALDEVRSRSTDVRRKYVASDTETCALCMVHDLEHDGSECPGEFYPMGESLVLRARYLDAQALADVAVLRWIREEPLRAEAALLGALAE